MKIFSFFILTAVAFFPGVSWALDCIKFENMEVSILKQENDQVHLEWKVRVINKCKKLISIKVQIQFADEQGKHLGNRFERLNTLTLNETREIRGETGLPSETYYKIQVYNFKASELPNQSE